MGVKMDKCLEIRGRSMRSQDLFQRATRPIPFMSSATCTPIALNARIMEARVMLLPLSIRQTCDLCTPILSPSYSC